MATTFTGYTDPFAATNVNKPAEEASTRAFRKLKKRNKQLEQLAMLHEQRFEEMEKRATEVQRAVEEARNKERSFESRLVDAAVKAIPGVIGTAAIALVKGFFSRGKK